MAETDTKLAANSIEGIAEPFLKRIENLHRDLESERGSYMARCKEIREDMAHVYDEAKDKGVTKKALKGVVKYRQLERKKAAITEDIDDIDVKSQLESLIAALGELADTPLGQAAAKAA